MQTTTRFTSELQEDGGLKVTIVDGEVTWTGRLPQVQPDAPAKPTGFCSLYRFDSTSWLYSGHDPVRADLRGNVSGLNLEEGMFDGLAKDNLADCIAQFRARLALVKQVTAAIPGIKLLALGDDITRGHGMIARSLAGWRPAAILQMLTELVAAVDLIGIVMCDEADFNADATDDQLHTLTAMMRSVPGVKITWPCSWATHIARFAPYSDWIDVYFTVRALTGPDGPTWEQVKWAMDESLAYVPKGMPFSLGNISIMGSSGGQFGWPPDVITKAIQYAWSLGAIGVRCYSLDGPDWRINRKNGIADQVGAAPGDPRWVAMMQGFKG